MAISEIFLDHLVEILLSLILLFNMGAYKQLYKKYDDLDERTGRLEDFTNKLKYSLFGIEEENGEGYMDEMESQFSDVESKLDEISSILENESEQREKDFRWLNQKLDNLVYQLVSREDLDIDRDSLSE